jgi:hypothetical protein
VEFLAELYLPAGDENARREVPERIRASGLRIVHSIYVPGDEMWLMVIDATTRDQVERLGIFDRVSDATVGT